MSIEDAHKSNKDYMREASKKLLEVRQEQWNWHYWLLAASILLMYPSPILTSVSKIHTESTSSLETAIYWLFLTGIYVNPDNKSIFSSHMPLYIMLTLLVLEKVFQRWQHNRYGCTYEKIVEFKNLD